VAKRGADCGIPLAYNKVKRKQVALVHAGRTVDRRASRPRRYATV